MFLEVAKCCWRQLGCCDSEAVLQTGILSWERSLYTDLCRMSTHIVRVKNLWSLLLSLLSNAMLTLTPGKVNALSCKGITLQQVRQMKTVFKLPRSPRRVLHSFIYKQIQEMLCIVCPSRGFIKPAGTLKTRLSRKLDWFIIYHFPNMALKHFCFNILF